MDDGRTLNFMNDSIYDFFKANYGTIKSTKQASKSFHIYKDFTVKQLKIELVQLKSQGANFAGRDVNKWFILGGRRRTKFQL